VSLLLGYMENSDFVIAADGRAGGNPESEYALKTIRVTPTTVLGCTGETKFMRPVLSALGFVGAERSEDINLFWDIELSGQPLKVSYEQAWGRVNRIISANADKYAAEDEKGLAAVLIGRKGPSCLRVSVWSRDTNWRPPGPEISNCPSGGRMFLGYLPPAADKDEVWKVVSDRHVGLSLEDRLAKAIRWCSSLQDGPERKINGNVFTRRMSEGFALRQFLDPAVEHNWKGPDSRGQVGTRRSAL